MRYRYLLIIILPVTLFILLPILFLLLESLVSDTGKLTLEYFKMVSLTSRQWSLMKNSLLLAVSTSAAATLMGVSFAFIIHRTDIRLKKVMNTACLVPLLIPTYIQALVWTDVFSSFIYTIPGGIFVFTLSFFPFVTIITGSGLQAADVSMEEAAIMSRGKLTTIWKITLPMVTPHIIAGAIIVFVFTIINFEIPDILRLQVYPIEIFIQFSAYYNAKAATFLSLPLVSAALVLIWGQMMFMKDKAYFSEPLNFKENSLFTLGRFRLPCFLLVFVIIIVSAIIPVFLLIKGAGCMENYVKAFQNSRDPIFYSFFISFISALMMTVFSFIVSLYLVRTRGVMARIIDYLLQLPFGVPSIVLGIGLIHVWNHQWVDYIYTSTWILIFAFVSAYTPFVIKIISAKVAQIPAELEEACLLETGSWFKSFFGILLPLSMPGIMTGFFTGFVLSLFNLGTALLVVPPGKSTLPISIYNFMHYGAMDIVYAQSLILIIIALMCGLILYPVYRSVRCLHGGYRSMA